MIHEIKSGLLTVKISEHGAELQSIIGADGCEYLWQGDEETWSDRAPILFPYVARLTSGRYSIDGKLYSMQIHGFASSSEFTAIEKKTDSLLLELNESSASLAQYPRRFSFRVKYTVSENRLDVLFTVINRDSRTMYFGLGGHPGFKVPLSDGLTFEDYRLRFAKPSHPKRVEFTSDCFQTGNYSDFQLEDDCILQLSHDMFDDDAIVIKDMCRQVTLESPRDRRGITVQYLAMPYLGIWHWPRSTAAYVCIEPWVSLPSKAEELTIFEEKEDLIQLEEGGVYENLWTIIIHK